MLAAPVVVQLNVLFVSGLTLAGLAVNETIAGSRLDFWLACCIEVIALQATGPAKIKRMRIGAQSPGSEEISPEKSSLLLQKERVEFMISPFFLNAPSGYTPS